MAAPSKGYALDIFKVLDRINNTDVLFYDQLDEEQRKGFAPVVAMKWMFGTPNRQQLVRLNRCVNPFVFPFGTNHKGLLYRLMCATSTGKSVRYKWIKATTTKNKPMSCSVLEQMYGYNRQQALEALQLLTKDDVLEMAEYIGLQGDEMTKIKAEFKV